MVLFQRTFHNETKTHSFSLSLALSYPLSFSIQAHNTFIQYIPPQQFTYPYVVCTASLYNRAVAPSCDNKSATDMGGFNGCVVVVVVVGALVVVAEQVMRLEAAYAVGNTKDSHRKVQTDVRRTKHVVAIVGGMI
jgi:hypothetical protein